jgi:hypothetical protein
MTSVMGGGCVKMANTKIFVSVFMMGGALLVKLT